MGMRKGQKQYGEGFIEKILQIKKSNATNRQVAEYLGVELKVVKNAINRNNRKTKKSEIGLSLNKRGRPRLKPMTTLEELQKRNKELEMENELLKKFHEELRG